MEKEQFYNKITELFEVTPQSDLSGKTNYKELEEWDSLLALEIIAMLDEEYDVELNGDDIRNAKTLDDLYDIIKARMNEV